MIGFHKYFIPFSTWWCISLSTVTINSPHEGTEENRRNGILPIAYYAEENENIEIDGYFEENNSDSDQEEFIVMKKKKITKKKTKVFKIITTLTIHNKSNNCHAS